MGTQAAEHNETPTTDSAANEHVPEQGLRYCVRAALERYFEDLNGHNPGCLYNLVIREVEQPLLETVLANTRGNQTRAAQLLGINRTTLRKKLRYYELD